MNLCFDVYWSNIGTIITGKRANDTSSPYSSTRAVMMEIDKGFLDPYNSRESYASCEFQSVTAATSRQDPLQYGIYDVHSVLQSSKIIAPSFRLPIN